MANAVASRDGKVTLTFKGGSGYDAPWIVVHADDLDDALDHVTAENAVKLIELMTRVQRAGSEFTGKAPVNPNANNITVNQRQQSNAPQGATQAPNGEQRHCSHGEMQFKSGVGKSNGKPWKGFFCPTPKDTPGQCEVQWLR